MINQDAGTMSRFVSLIKKYYVTTQTQAHAHAHAHVHKHGYFKSGF